MSEKKRILVVDDSPNEIRILMELLKDEYAVVAATTGEKAIESVSGDNQPDVILMDVTMEPMDGYEATTKILQEHPSLPVIFVSANTGTDEILKGFEVGGCDYITKPIEPDVLTRKVALTLQSSETHKTLQKEKTQATQLVMTALSSAGNLGIVLNFLREGLKLTSREKLADLLNETISKYQLDACICLDNNLQRSTSKQINPLEAELLHRASNMQGRILEKGSRLIIHFNDVAMLIKNMPIDDEVRQGELRDHLTTIAEGADLLNKKIGNEENIAEQRSQIVTEMLQEAQMTLAEIEASQAKQKASSMRIMDALGEEIEESFLLMGMTEEQEDQIMKIIAAKTSEALENFEKGIKMDEQLKRITLQLSELSQSFQ